MKYEVDFPEEIDQRLSQKASETGHDVVDLIQIAVGKFVDEDVSEAANGDWTAKSEKRRCALIDKDIARTITVEEQTELSRLDRMANEHFDRVAPPPLSGAQRLHQQLLKDRGKA